MAKNFVKNGNCLSFTPGANIASGQGVLLNGLFVIAIYDAEAGEECEGAVNGVYELPKTAANAPAEFAKAYWNDSAKEVTTTASGNTLIGVFAKAAANGDATAEVRLNGVSV